MLQPQTVLEGVDHGKIIEREHESGLSDGQKVTICIQPSPSALSLAPREGIRRSAGVWADDREGLEKSLEWNRQQREIGSPEIKA